MYMSMTDLTGKQVLSRSFTASYNEISVDISTFTQGIYFIKLIDSEGRSYISKIIKI